MCFACARPRHKIDVDFATRRAPRMFHSSHPSSDMTRSVRDDVGISSTEMSRLLSDYRACHDLIGNIRPLFLLFSLPLSFSLLLLDLPRYLARNFPCEHPAASYRRFVKLVPNIAPKLFAACGLRDLKFRAPEMLPRSARPRQHVFLVCCNRAAFATRGLLSYFIRDATLPIERVTSN